MEKRRNENLKQKGITLIALVITIIILLILVGISIGVLTGENGIIENANKAKEETEISNEKEIIDKSVTMAIGENSRGNLIENEFQKHLNKEAGKDKTEVTDIGEEFEVLFKESNRYYIVDKDGNVSDSQEIIVDKNPGDITKGQNGEELDGSEEHPYEIWNIEDLVAFSNMVNGEGVKLLNGNVIQITKTNSFSGKYVDLKRNLNFKSKFSYVDSERTDFGDINGNTEDGNSLIKEMITENGFKPIGIETEYNKWFSGTLNGNDYKIENLYKNSLLGCISGAKIQNLNVHGMKNTNNEYGIITAVKSDKGESTINNCHNYVNISNSKGSTVGGIISNMNANGKIINCSNNGNIEGGGYAVGGIVGKYDKSSGGDLYIENSYNLGNINFSKVDGISYSGCGGIIGMHQYDSCTISIKNCYNAGIVSGKAVYTGRNRRN